MSHRHHKPHHPTSEQEQDKMSAERTQAESPEELALEHSNHRELEEKLNKAENEMNEAKSQVLRVKAEMENVQKRANKDVSNAHKYALEKFVNELLPVVDSIERGLAIEAGNNEFALRIHEGMEMTLSLMLKTLEKFGAKQINPLGQPFNPDLHQAISMQIDHTVKPNTVLQVLQKGYALNDRLIRPALVTVAKEG